MTDAQTIEKLIDDAGGCGLFQFLLVTALWLSFISMPWTAMFMAYGSYNPGWTCLDDNDRVSAYSNDSLIFNDDALNYDISNHSNNNTKFVNMSLRFEAIGSYNYSHESCEVFEKCQHVEFNPEMSTIVSKWGLLCSLDWVPPFIVSMQMAGLLIGSFVGGHLGNRIGRKYTLYGGIFFNGILSLISAFSASWQMFTALRFFLGFVVGVGNAIVFIFPTEFVSIQQRGVMGAFPLWGASTLIFAGIAVMVKDWKYLHIINAVLSLTTCTFAFWVPESMRFLAIKGNFIEAKRVAHKIARTNRRPIPDTTVFRLLSEMEGKTEGSNDGPSYTFLDLFGKELMKRTLIVSFIWIGIVASHQAITFGVKELSGDFFLNFILLSLMAFICFPIVPLVANNVGRRRGLALFTILSSSNCLGVVLTQFLAPTHLQSICTTVFALIAQFFLSCSWGMLVTFTIELYPTSVRSLGYGFATGSGRLGAIIAPYLIPKSYDTLWISFSLFAVLVAINSVLALALHETRRRPLEDTFGSKPRTVL